MKSEQPEMANLTAGPVTTDELVMLDLSVDAVKATGVISSTRLQTLDSTLHTLRTLVHLTAAISQVLVW